MKPLEIRTCTREYGRLTQPGDKAFFIKGTVASRIVHDGYINIYPPETSSFHRRQVLGVFDTRIFLFKRRISAQFWLTWNGKPQWVAAKSNTVFARSLGFLDLRLFINSWRTDLQMKPNTDKIHGVTIKIS